MTEFGESTSWILAPGVPNQTTHQPTQHRTSDIEDLFSRYGPITRYIIHQRNLDQGTHDLQRLSNTTEIRVR